MELIQLMIEGVAYLIDLEKKVEAGEEIDLNEHYNWEKDVERENARQGLENARQGLKKRVTKRRVQRAQ